MAPSTTEEQRTTPPDERETQKLVIFACSGDLDKMWPTLILATTGAAMGMEVTVFFTFWGLFPLVREDASLEGQTFMQRMLAVVERPGMKHLRLSKLNMLGAGPQMMRKLARDYKMASPQQLLDAAVDAGVRLVPCQMTMDLLGLKREDLIEGAGEPAGATTALLEAQGATSLFI